MSQRRCVCNSCKVDTMRYPDLNQVRWDELQKSNRFKKWLVYVVLERPLPLQHHCATEYLDSILLDNFYCVGGGELAQLVRAWGRCPGGQGYESWSL